MPQITPGRRYKEYAKLKAAADNAAAVEKPRNESPEVAPVPEIQQKDSSDDSVAQAAETNNDEPKKTRSSAIPVPVSRSDIRNRSPRTSKTAYPENESMIHITSNRTSQASRTSLSNGPQQISNSWGTGLDFPDNFKVRKTNAFGGPRPTSESPVADVAKKISLSGSYDTGECITYL